MGSSNAAPPPEWDVLLSSSQKNLHNKIRTLIEQEGVDPNHANRVGQSALHIASLWGHVESVQVLLDCGADPNAQNNITGATPLHCAIQSSKASTEERQIQTAQCLLNAGADPSRGDFFGSTPADYCDHDDSTTTTTTAWKELLQVQVPPIFTAIQEENVEELSYILKQDATVVQSRHETFTPLLHVVELLVNDDNKSTADARLEMMKLLLQHGADPNDLPTANRNGHLSVQEDPGEACLHRICVALKNNVSDKETLQNAALLLQQEYHATVSPSTQQLLHDAARRNQLDFCKFMLEEMKLPVNVQGRQGMTPLQFAARSGKTEMVELLLQQEDIDVDIQDDRGQTALDAARVNNKNDIVALLEEHKSKTLE